MKIQWRKVEKNKESFIMRKLVIIFIILMALPAFVFSWPWDPKEAKPKDEKQKEEQSWQTWIENLKKAWTEKKEVTVPEEVALPEAREEETGTAGDLPKGKKEAKTEAQLKEEKKRRAALARTAAVQRLVTHPALRPPLPRAVEKPPVQPVQPIVTPPVPQPAQDVRILQIQEQIQETIRINDALQADAARQAAEIHRLSEQVRTQETILRTAPLPVPAANDLTAADNTQEILRQQRIRNLANQAQQPPRVTAVEDFTRNRR